MERAVVEGFRTDSLYLLDTNIRISQLLSAIIAMLCLGILISKLYELKKNPVPYNPVEKLPKSKHCLCLGAREDTKEQARRLFDCLRAFDEMDLERIYTRLPENTGVGAAVRNRLLRACEFCVKQV